MLFMFDLFVYDHVKANAVDILGVVSEGRMPCDVPWDSNKIATWMTGCCRDRMSHLLQQPNHSTDGVRPATVHGPTYDRSCGGM